MQTSTPLTAEQLDTWKAICVKAFPHEATAYLVGDRIIQVPNLSDTPEETFSVNPIERLKLEAEHGPATGFLHSHPATPLQAGRSRFPTSWPTSHDMVGWLGDDIRWGISSTDGEFISEPIWLDEAYIAPLEGRPFIHGIWDCYAAVRDWFRVNKGVTLKNYPRGMEWWVKGQDLYSTQFEDAGFVEVDPREAAPGDLALMHIHSNSVICHAAVIHDDLNYYHHTFSRTGQALSGFQPRSKWQKHVAKHIRHANLNRT